MRPDASAISVAPPHVRQRARARNIVLRRLGYKDYADYLRSPHWATIKAAYRASELPQTCQCGEAERLQLHHTTYERLGQERLEDLTPLCPECHTMIHVLERRGDIGLDMDGLESAERAKAYEADRADRVAQARRDIAASRTDRRWVARRKRIEDELTVLEADASSRNCDITRPVAAILRRLDAIEKKLAGAGVIERSALDRVGAERKILQHQ